MRRELGELGASQEHAAGAVVFEVGDLVVAEGLAVGGILAGGLQVAEEAVVAPPQVIVVLYRPSAAVRFGYE